MQHAYYLRWVLAQFFGWVRSILSEVLLVVSRWQRLPFFLYEQSFAQWPIWPQLYKYTFDESFLGLSWGFIWLISIGTALLPLPPWFLPKCCPNGFWLVCLVMLGDPDFTLGDPDFRFLAYLNYSDNIMMPFKFISKCYWTCAFALPLMYGFSPYM